MKNPSAKAFRSLAFESALFIFLTLNSYGFLGCGLGIIGDDSGESSDDGAADSGDEDEESASDSEVSDIAINFLTATPNVTGSIVDAQTGVPLEGVTLHGVIVSDAVNGGEPTEFDIERGTVNFSVEGGEISDASPVELNVIVAAEGYVSGSQPVTIDGSEQNSFTIRMVNVANPPAGTVVARNTDAVASATGEILQQFVLATDPEPNTLAQATLTVPPNTVLSDSNGNPVTGNLTTTIVLFNNQDDESLQAFPGGFAVNLSENENGEEETVVFESAGFIAIEIENDTGQEVSSFSSPVNLDFTVSGETVNPETGVALQNGDVIPIWSYDTDTGEWRFEGNATASGPDGNGNFLLSFSLSHLSYYNLDWKRDACSTGGTLTFEGNADRNAFIVELRWKDTGSFFRQFVVDDNFLSFYNAPLNKPVNGTVRAVDGTVVGTFGTDDLCTMNQTVTLDFSAVQRSDFTFEAQARCDGIALPFEINVNYWSYQNGFYHYGHATIRNGMNTVTGLIPDLDYRVWAYYGGYYGSVTVNSGAEDYVIDYELPENVCAAAKAALGY